MEAAAVAMASAEVEARLHVAILPSLGMGHLIPMAALARRLATLHGFEVTFLVTDRNPSSAAYLRSFPEGIHVESLPAPGLDDVPSTVKQETRIFLTVARSIPAIRAALLRIRNLVAVVVDFFGTDAIEAARDVGAAPYIFFPISALALSMIFHLPELDQRIRGGYAELGEPLRLPGCVPFEGRDMPKVILDRDDDAYKLLLRQCQQYQLAKGIIINTFDGIEPGALRALQDRQDLPNAPPVYPVGPLITQAADVVDRATCPCLQWLDQQPTRSVLYVCFGSGLTLPEEQIEELAAGLEMSGQRFLWVARPPTNTAAASEGGDDPLWFLPQGFRDRTSRVGLVVPEWAPQVAVLAHEATGGFLTHCGWNSTLEAMAHGVPLIAWPLFAEQRMNAVLLVQDIGVAIRPARDAATNGGVVGREEVLRVVKAIMVGDEGNRLRDVAWRLQKAANDTIAEGGASSKTLAQVADEWRGSAAARP